MKTMTELARVRCACILSKQTFAWLPEAGGRTRTKDELEYVFGFPHEFLGNEKSKNVQVPKHSRLYLPDWASSSQWNRRKSNVRT